MTNYIPLRDPNDVVCVWMCSVCKDIRRSLPTEECMGCEIKVLGKEMQTNWLKETVLCPECKDIEQENTSCIWCFDAGRVMPERAEWLKTTITCKACDGDPVLSCNFRCQECNETGRVVLKLV